MGDWIYSIIFLGAVTLVVFICVASVQTSVRLRRWKAAKLANDLDMELLASDNPSTLVVAGEINDRPSSVRYKKVKSYLEHIRNGFSKTPVIESEELLVSVECDCGIEFKVARTEAPGKSDDHISIALLVSSGLCLESKQKEKAAFIFEQPETVQSLIDLFNRSGASTLEVCANKVSALIVEPGDNSRSPAHVAAILELLDRFARLLEFVADEHHPQEN
ncbi:MAG: hypothetical protein IT342_14425 [Candidatus Melainabacteria bacterium]|nr:hypothetical protein [Candidatus Melainabacteria bacterium]